MPSPLPLVTLSGRLVELVPLSMDHLPDLLRIATDPRESFPYTSVAHDEPDQSELIHTLRRPTRSSRHGKPNGGAPKPGTPP